MNFKQKIIDELKIALKQGDNIKRDTLRMLDAAIKNSEIEKKKKGEGLDDSEVQEVIARSVKQRKDSIAQYVAGGRQDLAEKEKKEMEILLAYLPKQMDENEIREVVTEVIKETGAASKADMGKVMRAAMGKLKGQADGQAVKKAVEEELNR